MTGRAPYPWPITTPWTPQRRLGHWGDPALAQVNADNRAICHAFRDLIGPAIAEMAKGDRAEAAAHGRPLAMMVTVVFAQRTERSGTVNVVRDEKTQTFHGLRDGGCAAMDPAVLTALAER